VKKTTQQIKIVPCQNRRKRTDLNNWNRTNKDLRKSPTKAAGSTEGVRKKERS
jgi:hypothetical protein